MLLQEAKRYNDLLEVVVSTLRDLLKALKGLVVMSEQLETMAVSLFNNKVPTNWQNKSYSSLKPLGKKKCYVIAFNRTHLTTILEVLPRSFSTAYR